MTHLSFIWIKYKENLLIKHCFLLSPYIGLVLPVCKWVPTLPTLLPGWGNNTACLGWGLALPALGMSAWAEGLGNEHLDNTQAESPWNTEEEAPTGNPDARLTLLTRGGVINDTDAKNELLTATTFIYSNGAGITMAAAIRLTLQ